jgi:hypothetical protein
MIKRAPPSGAFSVFCRSFLSAAISRKSVPLGWTVHPGGARKDRLWNELTVPTGDAWADSVLPPPVFPVSDLSVEASLLPDPLEELLLPSARKATTPMAMTASPTTMSGNLAFPRGVCVPETLPSA